MRRRSSSLILLSVARMRSRRVVLLTRNCPRLLRSQMKVKPRKLKVSGFPSPRRARRSAAKRPNSIRRVLSGLSDSENSLNRLRKTTLEERDRGAWSHAGTDGTSTIQVGNRTETIEAQRNYGIRGNTPARFVCDGFSCPKRTSRALPPSREAGRPLPQKKPVGSRGEIRGPNSEARAAAFRGITKS